MPRPSAVARLRKYANAQRAPLGQVIGALRKAEHELDNDPISQHYGVTPDNTWALKRVAAELGWTHGEILEELERRGVSDRWQFFNLPPALAALVSDHVRRGAEVCNAR